MPNAIRNVIALVVVTLATLGLLEGLLQLLDIPRPTSPWISDPITGIRYAPSIHTRMSRPPEYDVEFSTNEHGFRDDAIGPKKGPRVLFLGDSFTSGYGVERGETFADLVEQRLGVEVINAGVGGYEIVHQLAFFSDRGRELQADLVVYFLYLGNDLSRNDEWNVDSEGRVGIGSRKFPLRDSRELKLRRLAKTVRYQWRGRQTAKAHPWEPFADYIELCRRDLGPDAEKDYQDVARLLGELRDAVVASGAKFAVVTFPFRTAVEAAAQNEFFERHGSERGALDFLRPEREIDRILESLRLERLSLGPRLRRHDGDEGKALYFPFDGHLNVAGHRFVARESEAFVRGLLDP